MKVISQQFLSSSNYRNKNFDSIMFAQNKDIRNQIEQ